MSDVIAWLEVICSILSLGFSFLSIFFAANGQYDRAMFWMGFAIWMRMI